MENMVEKRRVNSQMVEGDWNQGGVVMTGGVVESPLLFTQRGKNPQICRILKGRMAQ